MVDVTPRWKQPPKEPAKRTRLRAQSKKRRSEVTRRRKVLAQVEARDGWRCFAADLLPGRCGTLGDRQELEGHEIRPRGRQPGSHLRADLVRLLCPKHHDVVTDASGPLLQVVIAAGLLLPAEPLPGPTYKKEER